jgi:cation transport ATPase
MASALVDYARSNSVEPKPDEVSEFLIFPGEGIFGQIDGKDIYVGNKRIVARASSQQGQKLLISIRRFVSVRPSYEIVNARYLII